MSQSSGSDTMSISSGSSPSPEHTWGHVETGSQSSGSASMSISSGSSESSPEWPPFDAMSKSSGSGEMSISSGASPEWPPLDAMSQSSGSGEMSISSGASPEWPPLDVMSQLSGSDEMSMMSELFPEYEWPPLDAMSQSSGSDTISLFSGRSLLSSPRSPTSTAATSNLGTPSPPGSSRSSGSSGSSGYSSSGSSDSPSSTASSSTLESWSPPPSSPPQPWSPPRSPTPEYWTDSNPSSPEPPPSPSPPACTPEPTGSPPERLVIAIAGPTSSGKTTLSNLLLNVFGNGGAVPGSGFTSLTVHQDDYFVPNNLPTGPQVQWVECFLEEWMDNRLATRTCMRQGFTVDEGDKITPQVEERLIDEYRDTYPYRWDGPAFNREVLDLTLRHGKNRDTRLIIDTAMLDITIARARANVQNVDLDENKRNEIKDYRYLLKKSRLDGPEVQDKNDEPRNPSTAVNDGDSTAKDGNSIKKEQHAEIDDLSKKYEPINKDELTLKERAADGLRPFYGDPTIKIPENKIGQRGYVVKPMEPNSLVPHHCFHAPLNSVPYPGLPDGTRPLLSFITQLRAEVFHWIDAMVKLNDEVGFPGLNFIKGKFRGIVFVEGFTILEPAEPDEDAEPRNYDLSLFLSATRLGTRERRFARKEYQRPLMKRYMTWREFSYFDGVAWPAFIAEHQWIFNVAPEEAKEGLLPTANFENVSDLAKARGLEVRPAELDVEETLKWAVKTIMAQFEMKEKIAREKWILEYDDDEFVDPYEDWIQEYFIDGSYDDMDVESHGEWVQEYLMDENDLNIMFQMEKDKVDLVDETDLTGRHDPDNWTVEPVGCTCDASDEEDEDSDSWCTCWDREDENMADGPGNFEDGSDAVGSGDLKDEAKESHPGNIDDGNDYDDPWWGLQDVNLVEDDVINDDVYDEDVDSDEYVDDGTEAAAFWASDSDSDSDPDSDSRMIARMFL